MKPAAIILPLVLLTAVTAKSQLSLLPQIGLEQSATSIRMNDLSSFSPMGSNNNLKANLRADYRFRKGHGPYVSLGTSPAVVAFSFANPSTAINNFKATAGSLQWKLEGGYQYSSKPITLKKATNTPPVKSTTQNTVVRRSCGSYSYYHHNKENAAMRTTTKQNNNFTLRLQPSIGVAYLPSVQKDLESEGAVYQYNAGNYKTAVVSGMGFEFGKGKQRLFTLSAFYTKGLGNNEKTITNTESGKLNTNVINSKTSSWGMTVGVPFTFSKNKKTPVTIKAPTEQNHNYQGRCGSYRSGGCTRKL